MTYSGGGHGAKHRGCGMLEGPQKCAPKAIYSVFVGKPHNKITRSPLQVVVSAQAFDVSSVGRMGWGGMRAGVRAGAVRSHHFVEASTSFAVSLEANFCVCVHFEQQIAFFVGDLGGQGGCDAQRRDNGKLHHDAG